MTSQINKVYLTKVKTIKADSLGVKAANIIRSMIIRNEFPPGMRLIEEEIAQTLGVSRACVREAYMTLESEGLILRSINKYTTVVKFNKSDVEEIYKIRLAIEKVCVEACMDKKINPYKELRDQSQKITQICNDPSSDYLQWVEEDKRFHEIIVIASGNNRAIRIWSGISGQMRTLLFSQYNKFPDSFRSSSYETHMMIAEAINAMNRKEALTLLEEHILAGYLRTLECIEGE